MALPTYPFIDSSFLIGDRRAGVASKNEKKSHGPGGRPKCVGLLDVWGQAEVSSGEMSDQVMVPGLIEVPQGEVALLLESGYLYLEMQKNKEAEEIFAGVAALVPHSDVPLICLGNLFFAQGRFDRALKYQREALKRNPESALAKAHEGETLLFMKKPADAKKALERAIEMDPEGDAAQFASSLLDAMAAEVI